MRSVTRLALFAALTVSLTIPYLRNGYDRQNCSQYVTSQAGLPSMTAADIWHASGGLLLVRECTSLAGCEMEGLTEGDIVAFHGAHVAIFRNGALYDSDPRHNGPGLMQYDARDLWFSGPVRILRVLR